MNLETGEALVSFLDEKGAPGIVERAKILFPLSQIGAITDGQRLDIIKQSAIYGKYDNTVDRESAFEVLIAEAEKAERELAEINKEKELQEAAEKEEKEEKEEKKKPGIMSKVWKAIVTAITGTFAAILGSWVSDKVSGKKSKRRTSTKERVVKNATSAATRTITRDILGNLIK